MQSKEHHIDILINVMELLEKPICKKQIIPNISSVINTNVSPQEKIWKQCKPLCTHQRPKIETLDPRKLTSDMFPSAQVFIHHNLYKEC